MKSFLIVVAIFLSGCATVSSEGLRKVSNKDLSYRVLPFDSRTQEIYRAEFVRRNPGWPKDVKEDVLAGRVSIGMTAEQVKAAIGEPNDVNRAGSILGTSETWIYGGLYLFFHNNKLTSFTEI